jgi:diaminopimelate epimerase
MEFYKFHGTGNDFILIDNRKGFANLSNGSIKDLCDRRFGIGADGLIMLEDDTDCDLSMVYFNSDGKESTMCGNGGRCLAAFASHLQMVDRHGTLRAIDGIHKFSILERMDKTWQVRLGMSDVKGIINEPSGDMIIDTGSPHYVRKDDDPENMDILKLAKEIRYSDRFRKDGINVNFIREDESHITIRTYERGVEDETWSCGTGCVAAAVASGNNRPDGKHEFNVTTKGGDVLVSYMKSGNVYSDVYLTGPAVMVFKGNIEI